MQQIPINKLIQRTKTCCSKLFVCSIFILLSRESDCGAILWANPHSLKELSIFEFSDCFFDFLPLNLLLVRSH